MRVFIAAVVTSVLVASTTNADETIFPLPTIQEQEVHTDAFPSVGSKHVNPTPPWRIEGAKPAGVFSQSPSASPAAKPKFPSIKINGFFQLDAGYYSQDANNRQTLGDIQDGAGFRRLRFLATGNVSERGSYKFEFDLAQSVPFVFDIWMQWKETPVGNVRIGRFRQPFGMTELSGVKHLPFLERATPFGFAPFRQTGIMLFDQAFDERATWAVSGYRYATDNFGSLYSDDGGYGLAARFTTLPIFRSTSHLVHLGGDYSFNDPASNTENYGQTNEFFLGQNPAPGRAGLALLPIVAVPPFVSTGAIPTANTSLFNVEAAAVSGNWLVQSEARWATVRLLNGTTNTFPGAYLHVRWCLTGEHFEYDRANAVFGRIKPRCAVDGSRGGMGAWELAARASHINLNGAGVPGPGRRLNNVTLGVTWYVNDFVKFQTNWIHSDLNDPTFGDSAAQTVAARGELVF